MVFYIYFVLDKHFIVYFYILRLRGIPFGQNRAFPTLFYATSQNGNSSLKVYVFPNIGPFKDRHQYSQRKFQCTL